MIDHTQHLTFFAEPSLKSAVFHRIQEHHRLDQIVQGTYWEGGRGCFIGCSIHSDRHAAFPELLGLPEWLAWLGEKLFESGDEDTAPDFTRNLYEAIPVGVDPQPALIGFLIWCLGDEAFGALQYTDDERCHTVLRSLRETGAISKEDADAAEDAAREATWAPGSAEAVRWSRFAARNAETVGAARSICAVKAAMGAASAVRTARCVRDAAEAARAAWDVEAAGSAGSAFWAAARAELIRQFQLLAPAEDVQPQALPPQAEALRLQCEAEREVAAR